MATPGIPHEIAAHYEQVARTEADPDIPGASPHLLALGWKPDATAPVE